MEAIIAISKNNVIGIGNKLPWNIPEDLAHFKGKTLGKTIIAGTTTIEGLPKLPNRKIIQLSSKGIKHENAFDLCMNVDSLFIKYPVGIVIGGAETIKSMLPAITRLIVTYIDIEIPITKEVKTLPIQEILEGWVVDRIYPLSPRALVKEYVHAIKRF